VDLLQLENADVFVDSKEITSDCGTVQNERRVTAVQKSI
jgi:hypothetical protein